MGALSPVEVEGQEMQPIWAGLDAVVAFKQSQAQFIREELDPDVRWGAAGMTAALVLAEEFRSEIWPHRVPSRWELIVARREGRLVECVAGLDAEFARSCREVGR